MNMKNQILDIHHVYIMNNVLMVRVIYNVTQVINVKHYNVDQKHEKYCIIMKLLNNV